MSGPFPGDVLKRGWEAIDKARAALQKTEREIAWIEALAAYYQDYEIVPQQKRTRSYEAAMASLWARYPMTLRRRFSMRSHSTKRQIRPIRPMSNSSEPPASSRSWR